MMTTLKTVVMFGLIIYKTASFRISCPQPSERYLRGKAKCADYRNYTCLFDENQHCFSESCSVRFDFQRPGYRVTLRTNLHAGPCPDDLYQPFTFFTNKSSNCELKQSSCSEDGQIASSNGTTRTDKQCRCNFANGYSYVIEPKNICSCIPSVEDCSCYRKICSENHILSPDYRCINKFNWSRKFLCSSISDIRYRDSKGDVLVNTIHANEVQRVISKTKRTTFPLVIIIFTVILLLTSVITTIVIRENYTVRPHNQLHNTAMKNEGFPDEKCCNHVNNKFVNDVETEQLHKPARFEESSNIPKSTISLKNVKENMTKIRVGTLVRLEIGQTIVNGEKLDMIGSDNHLMDSIEWKKDTTSFKETGTITEIKDKLSSIKHVKSIVMWGPPGCGKTTSLHYIASYLHNHDGYKIIHCLKPSEIFNQPHETGRRAFVIDDICGRFVFSNERFLRWKRRKMHIESLLHDDNVKLLLTCSSAIFMTDIVQNFTLFTDNAFDLTTPTIMTNTIHTVAKDYRNTILTSLIERNISHKVPLPIIQFGLSLPLGDAIEYFIDSSEYFKSKLEELLESNRSAFYSLFICILKKGSIDEAVLTSDDHRSFTEISSNVCYTLDIDISRRQFLDNLYLLMDNYISKDNGLFTIKHTALFEILAVYFGEKMQKVLIRCADPEIITQHCLLKTFKNIAGNARFSIHVSEDNENLYFQRITERLLSRDICEVFFVRQMSVILYRQKLVAFLKDKGPDVVKQISLLKCKILDETPSLIAIRFGYVNLVKLFFDHNEDLNPANFEYLEVACETGNVPLVRLLVNRKININRSLSGGSNALHIACKNGFISLIHFLVNNDADVNCTDKQGNTPLIEACRNENESVVSLLLNNGSEINKSNLEGQFPLMIAAKKGITRLVKLLILKGADVNKTDFLGYSCLMRTIQSDTKNSEAVLTLLKVGVDVNCSSADGKTALLIAVQEQRRDIVIILIDYATGEKDMGHSEKLLNNVYANIINKCDNLRITPLMYACELRNDKFDVVKYLISKGANVNCCDKNERTPLSIALENNDIELFELLINNGANVNLPGVNRTTPLHEMCKSGQVSNVLLLISSGSEVDIVDRQSMTPLMLASKFGYFIITQALFHSNAKLDIADKNGTTALMFACMGGFKNIIRFLVENGADVNITDSNNWTALLAFISSPNDNAEIVPFLIENGADVNSSTKDDVSSLMIASFRGKHEIVKCLLRHNVDINYKDVYGKTPIFSACLSGNVDIVRVLMENGADARVVDKNGDTLESLARKNNLTEMVNLFGKK